MSVNTKAPAYLIRVVGALLDRLGRLTGAFGIKPFAAGSLFSRGDRIERDRRARLAIRYILNTNTVIPIPGLNSIHYVNNVAKAVMERRQLDIKEKAELDNANKQALAALPKNYQCLKNWQYV